MSDAVKGKLYQLDPAALPPSPPPVLCVLSWLKNLQMADLASEYQQSEESKNISSLFSLKGFYFQRVEDVPEYVQQVSSCTFHSCLELLNHVALL